MLCNSWIIVSRETDKPVLEIYLKSIADKVNTEKYEVLTAHDYLCRLNESLKVKG